MEPIGIFMGTWIDLSKKKTNVNIMQKYTFFKELDSGHPLLPKTGWEDEDLNLILRTKWKHFK
jgi:hypothetical protein